MNQLQAIAMNEGVRRKRGLWSQQGGAIGVVVVASMDPPAAARTVGVAGPSSTRQAGAMIWNGNTWRASHRLIVSARAALNEE